MEEIFFNLQEKLNGYRKEKRKFRQSNGYELNLMNPLSYSEKVVWKKIYDRNPLLPVVTDKYRVREYLRYILGEKGAQDILVPLLYVTDKPETIPFDNLPEEYIIKPNHASGRHIIIEKSSVVNRRQIIVQCRKWLSKPYGLKAHEWAYQRINRKIVVEKLLRDENGRLPNDYKFFIFHGKCDLIIVVYERFVDKSVSYYTPEWELLDIRDKDKQATYRQRRPENLDSMISLAELLGAHFDAVRVDLYLINKKIYFGELTNYSLSGRSGLAPRSYDYELGSKWKIVPGYWRQDNYIKYFLDNHLGKMGNFPMNIIIEKAKDIHKPAIMRLLKQANMHYIPSKEMPEITFENYFVAKAGKKVVGFCGYKVLSAEKAKTELIVVDKHYRGRGIGSMLLAGRMEEMLSRGNKKVIVNTDSPQTIEWYKRHFGYKEVGRLEKYHEFGDPLIGFWTTLESDLLQWSAKKKGLDWSAVLDSHPTSLFKPPLEDTG